MGIGTQSLSRQTKNERTLNYSSLEENNEEEDGWMDGWRER